MACNLTAVAVTLTEITGENREAVLALHVAPGQEEFVSSVRDSLAEAAEYPHARPWYRAVYASGEPAGPVGPVGFVMVSWNAEPQPPEIIGPWFLWKLLIDERYQGRGYGAAVVRHVAELVAAEGATELLTSYAPGDGGPAGFYQRLGFVPTGELDDSGEVVVRLGLPMAHLWPASADATSREGRAGGTGDPARRQMAPAGLLASSRFPGPAFRRRSAATGPARCTAGPAGCTGTL